MQNTFTSPLSDWNKALLLCLGILLSSFSALSQGGCDCPALNSCNACAGGLTQLTLKYTGGGVPVAVTAVDGAGHPMPGGINLFTNIITINSAPPTQPFKNGSVTVTVTALFGVVLGSQTIDTSCGVPIYQGTDFGGILTVVSGVSLNGGSLCCVPTIQDTEAPTFSDPCPANIQLYTPSGSCTAFTSWDPPDAVDNCGPVSLSGSHDDTGTNFPLGITTVTYQATDQYNNLATCSFTVEVIDNINPVISSCPANMNVPLDASCSYTVPNFTGLVTGTDNCDASVAITQSPAIGAILSGVGSTHTVTLTATDNVGNTNSCTFQITLKDQTNPVISACPANMDVALGASCSYAVPNFTGLVTATDNCDASVAIAQSPAIGSVISGIGSTHTITLTATDDVGNTNSCTFQITLKDQTNPVITACPANMDVMLGAACSYTLPDFTGLVTATDNCDVSVAITQSPAIGTVLSGVGSSHTITLTATDDVGNTNSCTFQITLKDQTNPVISACPANMDVALGATCSYTIPDFTGLVTATDNCDVSVAITQSPAIGAVISGVGSTHTVTLTATDDVGNTNSCTFQITLKDQTNPVISACPANMDVALGGSCSYTVPNFTGLVTATDNCDASVAITQSPAVGSVLSGIGSTHTITLTATDDVGNTNSCTFQITLKDQTNPVISACPANMDVALGASCSYTVPNFTGLVTATDNCDVSVAITQSPAIGSLLSGIGSIHTITLTATDDIGNTNSCTFQITLKDQTNPVISACPASMDVALGASCSYTVPDFTGLVTATDNCDVSVAITQSPAIGAVLSGVGSTHTVILTATDDIGNTNSCTFQITLKDQTNPVISACPANMDVALGASCSYTVPNFTGLVTAPDNCDVSVAITQSPAIGSVLSGIGSIHTITLTATDDIGNTNSCTFQITLKDQTNPVISACPASMDIALGASCSYTVPDFTGLVTATDNCDVSVAITQSPGIGAVLSGVGSTHTVTLTATDDAGNTNSCTFQITLKDQTNPVISACPANMDVALGAACSYTIPDFTGLVTATDNCDVSVAITQSPAIGAVLLGVGSTHTVTLTATDDVGNTNSCTFQITLKDQTNPVISACPANMDVALGTSCSYTVPDFTGLVTATDNCDVSVAITQSPAIGTALSGVGSTHTVTFTATDNVGNINSCTFEITLKDQTSPVINDCPGDVTVNVDPLLSCGANVVWDAPTMVDNCTANLIATKNPGSFFSVGETTVTYTATDLSGNATMCSFNVIVNDNIAPIISPLSNITASASVSSCKTVVNWSDPTVTDNCGIQSLTSDIASGTEFELGLTTVTYTATDIQGNTASRSFNVTVTDDSPPVISHMDDITAPVSEANCLANVTWHLPTVTDNCNVLSVSTDIESGSEFSLGSTAVTVTAKDVNGNIATSTFNVVVVDDSGPLISSMPDLSVSPTSGCTAIVTWLAPTADDDCGVQTLVSDMQSGSEFTPGKTTVTYTATDINGNSSTESFDVVVSDTEAPVIVCLSDIAVSATSSCGANVSWDNPSVTDCSDVSLIADHSSGDFYPIGKTTVTYTARDEAGNISSCTFEIIITDTLPPVFTNCPSPITVSASACDAIVTWLPPSVTDNCTIHSTNSTHVPGTSFPIGTTVVTYAAVDDSGNSASCSFEVTVTDENPPIINNCPTDISVLIDASGELAVDWTEPTAHAGCGTVELKSTHKPGDIFKLGTTETIYTATDDSGRTTECSFNVIVTYAEIDFIIADLVTPNGDGINDFWELKYLERFTHNSVRIFDRWGGVIYTASGYNNESVRWEGENKTGKAVPTGTYFYSISVRLGDTQVQRDGFIELIR
jgi:gliding motility-associated-like protein